MPAACLEATLTLVKFCENNNIAIKTQTLENQVLSWYANSDIVDPDMLAAAVLNWGNWRYVDYQDWIEATERWFPQHLLYEFENIEVIK